MTHLDTSSRTTSDAVSPSSSALDCSASHRGSGNRIGLARIGCLGMGHRVGDVVGEPAVSGGGVDKHSHDSGAGFGFDAGLDGADGGDVTEFRGADCVAGLEGFGVCAHTQSVHTNVYTTQGAAS